MDKPTMKKYISLMLTGVSEIEGLENNDVIFVTSIGYITGKPLSEEETQENSKITSDNTLYWVTKNITDDYRKEYNITEEPIDGNDGYIILKDVTIKYLNSTTKLGSLILFFDQIIGVTFGNI